MKNRDYAMIYDQWFGYAWDDPDIQRELRMMRNDAGLVREAFYKDLEFGTDGLRGEIGAGTNRVNIYTIGKATQGLADYLKQCYAGQKPAVAIGYGSRRKSQQFALYAAKVLAGNDIKAYLFREIVPTPCVSYAVRSLECQAGIMIAASHSPADYNGYKVYGSDGCQITVAIAEQIAAKMKRVDIFEGAGQILIREGFENGMVRYIDDQVLTNYVAAVKQQSVLPADTEIDRTMPIVYSPLPGTGLKPILRVLQESGYTNIQVVKEQQTSDGYLDPEIPAALEMSMRYGEKYQAELLLATDPDFDRVGIGVKDNQGRYVLLSGNETGLLLFEYICSCRSLAGTMPPDPVLVKTDATADLVERIAAKYGVKTVNVLTGFKFIGEMIGSLEAEGRAYSYLFDFEESYGYLSATHVRDKDGVNAVFLICEMFAYYRSQGISLWEKLQQLFTKD